MMQEDDVFNQLRAFLKQSGKNVPDAEMSRMQEDWAGLFFDSKRGQRVFADMIDLSQFFGAHFVGNSFAYFLEGSRWFVSQIIKFSGLDNADGLHRIQALRAHAEKERENDG